MTWQVVYLVMTWQVVYLLLELSMVSTRMNEYINKRSNEKTPKQMGQHPRTLAADAAVASALGFDLHSHKHNPTPTAPKAMAVAFFWTFSFFQSIFRKDSIFRKNLDALSDCRDENLRAHSKNKKVARRG